MISHWANKLIWKPHVDVVEATEGTWHDLNTAQFSD